MQNFGRGMWRRVGDYERIQSPLLLKKAQIEQLLLYKEYMQQADRQKKIKEHRDAILKNMKLEQEIQNKFVPDIAEQKVEDSLNNSANIRASDTEATKEVPITNISLDDILVDNMPIDTPFEALTEEIVSIEVNIPPSSSEDSSEPSPVNEVVKKEPMKIPKKGRKRK